MQMHLHRGDKKEKPPSICIQVVTDNGAKREKPRETPSAHNRPMAQNEKNEKPAPQKGHRPKARRSKGKGRRRKDPHYVALYPVPKRPGSFVKNVGHSVGRSPVLNCLSALNRIRNHTKRTFRGCERSWKTREEKSKFAEPIAILGNESEAFLWVPLIVYFFVCT